MSYIDKLSSIGFNSNRRIVCNGITLGLIERGIEDQEARQAAKRSASVA